MVFFLASCSPKDGGKYGEKIESIANKVAPSDDRSEVAKQIAIIREEISDTLE